MAIADRIKQPPPPALNGMPCSIGALFTQLDEAESAALNILLYEMNLNAGQVYDALRDEGYTVGRQSINRHRGEKCRCHRSV